MNGAEVINALKGLIKKWASNMHLKGNEQLLETNLIHFLQSILQGDSMSLFLFILYVNSLSYLLEKLQEYRASTK